MNIELLATALLASYAIIGTLKYMILKRKLREVEYKYIMVQLAAAAEKMSELFSGLSKRSEKNEVHNDKTEQATEQRKH